MHYDHAPDGWDHVVQGFPSLRRAVRGEKARRERAGYQEKLQSHSLGLKKVDVCCEAFPCVNHGSADAK